LHKDLVYFLGPGCYTTTPPAGDLVYHASAQVQATKPDIYVMSLKDLLTRSSYRAEVDHADADWGHEYMPRISNDNRWMVYGATTGCQAHYICDYEIFIHELGVAGHQTRITFNKANDNYPDIFIGRPGQSS
jgi:hypothetical protein